MIDGQVRIVGYAPEYRDAFRDLNLEWIERDFVVEESDRVILDSPDATVIARGGEIFVALEGDTVIGVCSLVPASANSWQLAKMAVSPSARGRGIGRLLAQAALDYASVVGASQVELFTNTVLAPAMGLYRSLGFVEVPFEGAEHARSNIRMALVLRETDASR